VTGTRKTPKGITLIGGKTGNTYDAGSCLVMYGKDSADTPYISIIMGASSRRNLYDNMTFLWAAIP
jgi:D-alanyl-D-alanine carboxypeptidase (penicillin-binding protein 5/6)